jgi:hypothetical protein
LIGQRAGLRLSFSRSFRLNSILRDLHGFTYREGRFWAAFVSEIYPRTGFLGTRMALNTTIAVVTQSSGCSALRLCLHRSWLTQLVTTTGFKRAHGRCRMTVSVRSHAHTRRLIKDVISAELAFTAMPTVTVIRSILARFQGRPSVRKTAMRRLLRPGKQTNTQADLPGSQKSAIRKVAKLLYMG